MVVSHRQESLSIPELWKMPEIPYSPKNLEIVRNKLGLSRKEVFIDTGISESALYGYETGAKDPTSKRLVLLGAYYSMKAKQRLYFTCDWDEGRVEEFQSFDMTPETFQNYRLRLNPPKTKKSQQP